MFLRRVTTLCLLTLGLAAGPAVFAAETAAAATTNLELSIERLRTAHAQASAPARAGLAEQLATTLLEARRYEEAERLLRETLDSASASAIGKARAANLLGQALAGRGKPVEAAALFAAARRDSGDDAALHASATINLAKVSPPGARLELLRQARTSATRLVDEGERARLLTAIGAQAAALAGDGRDLARQALLDARTLAQRTGDHRHAAEVADTLARLDADSGRRREALRWIDEGVLAAGRIDARDLLMNLEWQRGRLWRELGDDAAAIAAYQRAVESLESIRQDIPVTYEGGRSSFRETLSPIYLGLADLLLARLGGTDEPVRLRRARDVVELIKQSELQDFLGDRCAVDSARRTSSQAIPPGIAIYYPVILPDRLELLVETQRGLFRVRSPVNADRLRAEAIRFGSQLRNRESYLPQAQQLYDWLIRPVADELARQQVHTLVAVPDGALRLIPLAALHDGSTHLIERLAIVTAPGMTLTADSRPLEPRRLSALLAGLAEPGPVVEKIPAAFTNSLADDAGASATRGIRTRGVNRAADSTASPTADGGQTRTQRYAALREMYALPGVRDEVLALSGQMVNDTLVDEQFTLEALNRGVGTGKHQIVHLASHGFFGGTAEESFIMTYDEILSIGRLQGLLQSDAVKDNPIELLTLSACQTAEGDDRSPLGISGAALNAKARSALGTLWPVSDDAARDLMPKFYLGMVRDGHAKALALRQAQTGLLADPRYAHPFFWAPFILVGNWQ